MKSPEELTALFRERGLKVTPQRQCIFRVLHESEHHPTAEWVYEAACAEMPTISLRTVYGTLNDLAAMGELRKLGLGTGSARFDPTGELHHHLLCESCGEVRDLHLDFTDVQVPARLREGFEVAAAEIVFRGLCASCASEREPVPVHRDTHPSHPTPQEETPAHG